MKPDSAIVFDLGGVILNLSIQKTVDAFRNLMGDFDQAGFVGTARQANFFDRYEIGETSTEEFYREFLAHNRTQMDFETFRSAQTLGLQTIHLCNGKTIDTLSL